MADTIVPGATPANPPGLPAISYRAARYGQYREAMLTALARDRRYLTELNTRDPADPTIALIDSWAVAGDVLSFYAERIANEAFLPTATERGSLRNLVRLIDYELRPGKAAETLLAFTLEAAPGAPAEVPLPIGLRVNSIPGPGETMVGFETVEAITGRPDLNAMRPRLVRTQALADVLAAGSARCSGLLTAARRGDGLVVIAGTPALKRITAVRPDAPAGITHIDFAAVVTHPPVFLPLFAWMLPVAIATLPLRLGPAFMAGQVLGRTSNQRAFEANLAVRRFSVHAVAANLRALRRLPPPPPAPGPLAPDGVYRFRARAAVFGHNPLPSGTNSTVPATPGLATLLNGRRLKIDPALPDLAPGGLIAFTSSDLSTPFFAVITDAATVTGRNGPASVRATELLLDRDVPATWTALTADRVALLLDSERLDLAPLPVTDPVTGATLLLDDFHPGLAEGRPVAITGERADLPGVIETEFHSIDHITLENGFTSLTLKSAILGPFVRATVFVNGNIARATHGESGAAILGSGNAALAGQRFRLPIKPLTHISAETATGRAAELVVRVDNLLWHEVPALRDAGPLDRVYMLRQEEDGSTVLQFGDGITGARLPSGTNNIVAAWRKGLGSDGLVRAGQLSLPAGAPQGLKAVTNPLPAAGAADGETLDDARANAPLSVLTLGRIVTLRDYEDFARGFAGIAKAHAGWGWTGSARSVFLTVAGIDGAVLAEGNRDLANLRTAIAKISDTSIRVTVAPHRPASFRLAAKIAPYPDYVATDVLAAVEAALRTAFGFTARGLGQPVARSEIIAIIQAVPGVDWIDLDFLYRGDTPQNAASLTAALPRSGTRSAPAAAELLTLDPGPLDLRLTA